MFANPDKFQAIVGIETDNELLFNKHSALLCKKSGQSVRLQNQMGKMEKEI